MIISARQSVNPPQLGVGKNWSVQPSKSCLACSFKIRRVNDATRNGLTILLSTWEYGDHKVQPCTPQSGRIY
jgi:hypothetical protein